MKTTSLFLRPKLECIAVWMAVLAFTWVGSAQTNLGVFYKDPAGGWTYAYTGTNASFGVPDTTANFDGLDGTWSRSNGSSSWDGSPIGGTIGFGSNAPGGASIVIEGDTTFLRVQDCGDPRDHGFNTEINGSSTNSNRKIYFGHDLAGDGVSGTFLDEGVTITFRARVPTTGLLDPSYSDTGGENRAVPGGDPWPATGNGYLGHDGGKGNFGIRQAFTDSQISFSLAVASDELSSQAKFGTSGLVMNSLNGTTPSGTVDAFQNEGTLNVLALPSVTDDFHEFWIVIQSDQTASGTHKVDVYVDGCLQPQTFIVTAGNGDDYGALDYIGMGAGATGEQGAVDVDFYAYKPGIFTPEIADAQGPVGFSVHPVNAVGGEGGQAAFSVVSTGGPPRLLTWQRSDGTGGFTNLPGCSAVYPTLVVSPLQGSDNGAQFRCIVSNSVNAATSSVATLTVDTDSTLPTVVRSYGKYTFTNATVVFSEPVSPATANAASNYVADNGLSILNAALAADGTKVALTTSAQTPGTTYTLTLNNIRDVSFNQNRIATNTQTSFTAWVLGGGFLVRERYLGITGNTIAELTASPKYPSQAEEYGFVNSGDVAQSAPDIENYGGRLTGWIIPPVNGDYTFQLRGDDDTELRLSTSNDPALVTQIIYAPGAGNPYLASAPITLVGGQRYAIEALWKEGVGGDYMQVAWLLPGSTNIDLLPCTALEAYVDPTGASMNITTPPQSQTVLQNRTATFMVVADYAPAGGPVNYVWQRDNGAGGFTNLGCGGATYTTPLLAYPADNGSQYRVIVAVPGASATSSAATLTVLQDLAGPAVVSANRAAACADSSLTVVFDELLDPASATTSANYEIVNLTFGYSLGTAGTSLAQAPTLAVDGKTVSLLASAPLTNGALYKVVVTGVKDLALNNSGTVNYLINLNGARIPTGAQNMMVVEAENYDTVTPRVFDAGSGAAEYSWFFNNTRAGFSGSGVMQNLPNLEGNRPPGAEGGSLDFCVNFPAAGTYYAWVRGGANGGADNSIHVGIDGVVPLTGVNLQSGFETPGYVWCGWINSGTTERALLDVPGPGHHTVHIFMREDGFFADKLLLTTDAGYTPAGLGPDETPRDQANVPSIGILPGTTLYTGSSVTFSLQTVKGLGNVVEYKNTLNDAAWVTLTSFTGDGGIVPITDPGPLPTSRFYRARVVIP